MVVNHFPKLFVLVKEGAAEFEEGSEFGASGAKCAFQGVLGQRNL